MPPCQVAWGIRGLRRNGDRAAEKGAQRGRQNSYFLISDFALQRAQPLPSLFLPFSPSSRLILVCTEGSVNNRTQEAQFLPGDNQRPLRHRFLPIKGQVSAQMTQAALLWSLYPDCPAALREVRGLLPTLCSPLIVLWVRAPSCSGVSRVTSPRRYTMTKSSAVLFILIFSLIFKLEELVRPQLSCVPPTPTDAKNNKGDLSSGLSLRVTEEISPAQVALTR